MTEDLEDDLSDLQQILALGNKEAADIVSEVTSKVYRCAILCCCYFTATKSLQSYEEITGLRTSLSWNATAVIYTSTNVLFCTVAFYVSEFCNFQPSVLSSVGMMLAKTERVATFEADFLEHIWLLRFVDSTL